MVAQQIVALLDWVQISATTPYAFIVQFDKTQDHWSWVLGSNSSKRTKSRDIVFLNDKEKLAGDVACIVKKRVR